MDLIAEYYEDGEDKSKGGDGGVDAGGAGRRRHQGLHDRRQGGQGVG